VHFVDTHKKVLPHLWKEFFLRRCIASRVRMRANFLHYLAIALPICWCSCTQLRKHQRQEVDSLYFIITRGFFGVCIRKRGYVFWGHSGKKKQYTYKDDCRSLIDYHVISQ